MAGVLMTVPVGEGDGFVVVEVDPRDVGESVQLAARGGRAIAAGTCSLGEMFERLGPAVNVILKKLRSTLREPAEIKVEFGGRCGSFKWSVHQASPGLTWVPREDSNRLDQGQVQ